MKKLLSIGHSYVVGVNRSLPAELARAGGEEWNVTAVAPIAGLGGPKKKARPHPPECDKGYRLESIPVYFQANIHVAVYGEQLRRILNEQWDVIHCWEEPFSFRGGQVALWLPKPAALVYTTFQNLSKRYPPPFNSIERYALSRAAGWITGGRTVEDTLMRRQLYAAREHRVIPLGVDVELFCPSADLRSEVERRLQWTGPGGPVVGFSGRFVEEKGLQLLMTALDRVETPWRALFVGGGPLEGRLRRWASRSTRQVRIVTEVSHHEVPQYLNAMDILCAPSQTTRRWREQFGRMLIEAFACGVPIIASDSGEIPYVVGGAGMIVGEKDEKGWVDALTHLLKSDGQRRELSSHGLERARNTYSWSTVAEQSLQFFDELRKKSMHRQR